MQSNKIRIYELVDPNEIIKNEQLIRGIFFELLKVPKNSSGHEFSISPVSGWINYANNNELYSNLRKKTLLPIEAKDCENEVRRFIAEVNKQFLNNELYKRSGLPLLIPSSIYLIESTIVFQRVNYPDLDHWLLKFGVKLNSGKESADVFGAAFEIRIGNLYGKDFSHIIGFSLRWRPCKSSLEDEKIKFKDDHHDETTSKNKRNDLREEHSHEEHHHDEEDKTVVMYKLDGETIPQNFLSPYYISPSGHHLEFTPASKNYSVNARIFEIDNDNGKELFPDIKGGSGDFIYDWAYWEQGDFNGKISVLENALSLSVPIGVYSVILHITDRKTAVVCQTQSTVYALGNELNRFNPTFETKIEGCIHPLADNYNENANVDDGSCVFTPPIPLP